MSFFIIFAQNKENFEPNQKIMKRNKILLTLGLLAFSMAGMAQEVFDVTLYNGRPTYDNGDPKDTAKVRVYLPKESAATGRAVVICPGGGYEHLAMKKEGYDWAEFFQSNGIAAIVLKYRMPHGNPDVPVSDAEQAMRLVRMNARGWHVSLNDVGIMGFSAGGHLASTIATQSTGDAKANFQILFYPVITMMEGYGHEGSFHNFLGDNDSKKYQKKYSSDMHVTRTTPRAFIALSDDDATASPQTVSTTIWSSIATMSTPHCMSIPLAGMAGEAISASSITMR